MSHPKPRTSKHYQQQPNYQHYQATASRGGGGSSRARSRSRTRQHQDYHHGYRASTPASLYRRNSHYNYYYYTGNRNQRSRSAQGERRTRASQTQTVEATPTPTPTPAAPVVATPAAQESRPFPKPADAVPPSAPPKTLVSSAPSAFTLLPTKPEGPRSLQTTYPLLRDDRSSHICRLHNDVLKQSLDRPGTYVCKYYGNRNYVIQKVEPVLFWQVYDVGGHVISKKVVSDGEGAHYFDGYPLVKCATITVAENADEDGDAGDAAPVTHLPAALCHHCRGPAAPATPWPVRPLPPLLARPRATAFYPPPGLVACARPTSLPDGGVADGRCADPRCRSVALAADPAAEARSRPTRTSPSTPAAAPPARKDRAPGTSEHQSSDVQRDGPPPSDRVAAGPPAPPLRVAIPPPSKSPLSSSASRRRPSAYAPSQKSADAVGPPGPPGSDVSAPRAEGPSAAAPEPAPSPSSGAAFGSAERTRYPLQKRPLVNTSSLSSPRSARPAVESLPACCAHCKQSLIITRPLGTPLRPSPSAIWTTPSDAADRKEDPAAGAEADRGSDRVDPYGGIASPSTTSSATISSSNMHPQQAAVDYQAAITASVPLPYQQIDYGMDMMLSGAAVSVYDPSGMQMNPQSFLGSTQYPSVTLGSVHMYATPTTQYMAAGPTTHYNASSHHHQSAPGSQVPPPPPPSVPNQFTNSPQAYTSPQMGQPAPQAQAPAYVPVSSGYAPEQMSAMVLPMNPAQQPLQIAMTAQPYHHEQPMQPQTPSSTPRPATGASESGAGTPTSLNPANPLNLSNEELKQSLTRQLEYYFSRENLARDAYLNSQMDPDQFVDIATIANFNQVKRLTNDINLVTLVLKESSNVQVDLQGKKVRPNHARSTVILREIPNNTSKEEIENLFKSEKCPKFVHIDPPCSNMWYVNFETERDALAAFDYLREEVKTFKEKPIMARIKARSMNRVSSSGGSSSQPPSTPTALVSPVTTSPGAPGVSPGSINMSIPQQPAIQGVVTSTGVTNPSSKNGYPRQQQPSSSQTPQQQQHTILPYPMIPQQASMVPAQGPAQPMQPGNGQQSTMAAMTPTSIAQTSYPYVGTTNASQPIHGGQLIYMPQQQFYPPGLSPGLSLFYPNFSSFPQNVVPVDNQLYPQTQFKSGGANRAGGSGGSAHSSYGKPRARTRGGGGSISGDRVNNDQRYQNQATYQAFSAPAVNPVQPSSQQPPYNNYHFGRVSSRASWDGNSTSKKGTQGTSANDQSGQQINTTSNGPVPTSSPNVTPSSVGQSVPAPQVSTPNQASSQPSQMAALEPNEAASMQQQQAFTVNSNPPLGQMTQQAESPDEAPSSAAIAFVAPTANPIQGTQSTFTRGDAKSSRSNDDSASSGYQSQQLLGYVYTPKSSSEQLHGKELSRRGKGRGGLGTRGGRSDDGSNSMRDVSSGRGGYSGGRGSYHPGGGYRGQNANSAGGNVGTSNDGGHQHHMSQSSSGAVGISSGSSSSVANPPAKTPPAPEFEMKGNDFPALPGVPTAHTEVRKPNENSESGSIAWGGDRFLDVVKGTTKHKLTSSNSSSTSSRKDPAEDQDTDMDCVLSERVTVNAASQITESKAPEMQSSSSKTTSPPHAVSSSKTNSLTPKPDETNCGTSASPLVNGDLKSSVSSVISVNTSSASFDAGSGLASPGNGQKSNDGKLSYAQMAQKKKEKEEREAAEKAALAASTSNLEITENTKKIVKDSAVNKKLHGVNSKDIDNQKCPNVINSASGATTIIPPTSNDRNSASNESGSKATQNTFQRSKPQGASKDQSGSSASFSSASNNGPDNRKSSVNSGGASSGSGQQRHSGSASNSKKSLSGSKSATTPTSTGAVLSTSSSQPESVGTSK